MSFPCDMTVYIQPERNGISGLCKIPAGVIAMISRDACSIELLNRDKEVRVVFDAKPKEKFILPNDIVFMRVAANGDRHFDLVRA